MFGTYFTPTYFARSYFPGPGNGDVVRFPANLIVTTQTVDAIRHTVAGPTFSRLVTIARRIYTQTFDGDA